MPHSIDIFLLLTLAGSATACARPDAPDRTILESRQSQLREIADMCGLHTRELGVTEGGEIRLRPSPDTRYEVVDCTLAQLRDRGLVKHMPMAFVGNEIPAEEVGNHASPH